MITIPNFDIKALLEGIKKISGIDFSGYRQEMIRQRISARIYEIRL
jgi:hypothetical protein